ncbi:MAG: FN3 associated domain-containing protein, partial [Verrucomicrobiota bacterium]
NPRGTNRVIPHSRDNDSPTKFHHALKANAEYRCLFGDHVHRAFFNGGVLHTDPDHPEWDPEHPDRNRPAARWVALTDSLRVPLMAESARWGDYRRTRPYTVEGDLLGIRQELLDHWFPYRSALILEQFRDESLYPRTHAPEFSQPAGILEPGAELVMKSKSVGIFTSGMIYYTMDGADPRLPGGELNEASAMAYRFPIFLERSTQVRARALTNTGSWSALQETTYLVGARPVRAGDLVLTRIHYHPAAVNEEERTAGFEESDFEFLEWMNVSEGRVSLESARVDGGISYSFDRSSILTELDPGQRMILANHADAFAQRFGNEGLFVVGDYEGKLSNGGEAFVLLDSSGEVVLEGTYEDGGRWPSAADGDGYVLVRRDFDYPGEGADPLNWRLSVHNPPDVGVDDGLAWDDWLSAEGNSATKEGLMRFGLGDAAPRLNIQITKGQMELAFANRVGVDRELFFVLEHSTDLNDWQPLSLPLARIDPAGYGFEQRRFRGTRAEAEGYIRLRVALKSRRK